MLDRDLKMMAIQIVSQLPEDKSQAKRVLALIDDLLETWLHADKNDKSAAGSAGFRSPLPGQVLGFVDRRRE